MLTFIKKRVGLKLICLFFFLYFSSSKAGGTGNMIQSRSEAAQIFRQTSREKPVATVKPMLRQEESSPNLLGDLLKRQDEFLKPASKSTFEPKEPIHQKEVGRNW